MILVALTAGVCEEILFRGYVTWYFLAFWPGTRISLALAVIISSILFGFGHIYLGVRQVGTSAVGGVLFAAIVRVAGSLLPAMMLHAALDLNSFDLGYRALSKIRQRRSGSDCSGVVLTWPNDSPLIRNRAYVGVALAAKRGARRAALTC